MALLSGAGVHVTLVDNLKVHRLEGLVEPALNRLLHGARLHHHARVDPSTHKGVGLALRTQHRTRMPRYRRRNRYVERNGATREKACA